MEPQLYGWQHLTFLALLVVVGGGLIILSHFFIKTEKQKMIFLKCVAAFLFVWIIINRISIAIRFNDPAMFIPNSYCGMTSLVLSIMVLLGNKNNITYHFLWYMGFFGGLATMLYPDFLGQNPSFFYIPTISGMMHHGVLLLLCILMVQHKWFSPDIRRWWVFPAGLGIYVLFGLFCMDIFGWGSSMEINSSLISGTPLNWWFVLLVGSAILFIVLLFIEWLRCRKSGKKLFNFKRKEK